MKKLAVKKALSVLCIIAVVLGVFTAVPDSLSVADASNVNYLTKTAYTGEYSETDGTYAGTDDLGRILAKDYETKNLRSDRYVGLFYFLWQGEHGTGGPYDNTKIVANNPFATWSEELWMASGGGGAGAHHFWSEPLFGYYRSADEWVMRKHLQMFVDAKLDFICFDTSNGFTYDNNVLKLIDVWYEYLEKGYDVPKLTFYTYANSGATMEHLYNNFYNNAQLKTKYPRLDELWFYWEGKPMMVGVKSQASQTVSNYFRIKDGQWPNVEKFDDGFPWMEFHRLNTWDAIYHYNGKSIMNVSVAQHDATCRFSSTAWYGSNDRTRSYVNGANSRYSQAYKYGYNFANQWDFATLCDPDLVFVTGFNEWVAQRQNAQTGVTVPGEPIIFVDCADVNSSRDIEPMRGYFGDNYFMQFIDYVRKYKGADRRVNTGDDVTIDINGDMSQWESDKITAKYTDYENDIADRSCAGFGSLVYTDYTGRNDIINAKVTKDAQNIYFYVETADKLTSYTDNSFMTLFIKNNESELPDWYGYQYAVNYETPLSDTKAYLSKINPENGKWTIASTVDMKIDQNKLMLRIPRSEIEMTDSLFDLEFKWADNCTKDDFWSFYENGDCAPYGRLNYVYSNCVLSYNGNISLNAASTFTYHLNHIQTHGQTVHVSGWAVHNQFPSSNVEIHAYLGGSAGSAEAEGHNLFATNMLNKELNTALEISGTHGFKTSFTANKTGRQPLYLYAVLENDTKLIYEGYVDLTNTTSSPVGVVDNLFSESPNTISIRGWGYDPDALTESISVRAEVNGVSYDLGTTDVLREDVNNTIVLTGNHGFEQTITTDFVGEHNVKVYLIDENGDADTLVTERTVDVSGVCTYYTDENTIFETQVYGFSDTIKAPDTPQKEGYIFKGWEYSHDSSTMPHKNITARAQWIMLADVDNDGTVSITDATHIQLYLAKQQELSDDQLKAADTDKSSKVDISDATLIQRYLALMIDSLDDIK